jgi:hypothetical protein
MLTFQPGQMSKTIAIPILMGTATSGRNFAVALSNPNGGASLGSPAALTVTLTVPSNQNQSWTNSNGVIPNAVGPTIKNLQLLTNGGAVTGIVLYFDRALDPARADNVANYGGLIRSAGPGGVFGTLNNGLVGISSASYDPTNNTVTLTPAGPMPLNTLYQLTVNQNANALANAGVADTTEALLNAGTTNSPYVAEFSLGTRLTYIDATGNKVGLKLTGGGLLELRLGPDGDAQQLRILGAVPGKSSLQGQVRRAARGATGHTPLPVLIGSAGVKVHLKSFTLQTVATAPATPTVPRKPTLVHRIRHILTKHTS